MPDCQKHKAMRCPTLAELPPPPPGKTGWPWTEESSQLPESMPDGGPWPRISIVTPSYNQDRYVEETIRSVLLQGYPNLEYSVIDGGSNDSSPEIIKKYEKWLTFWVSEPDRGQSHAINKGLTSATGQWANWLNSDDYFLRDALREVALMAGSVTQDTDVLMFGMQYISADGETVLSRWYPVEPRGTQSFFDGRDGPMILQPSTFVRTSRLTVLEECNYAMDWTLYFTLCQQKPGCFSSAKRIIASAHVHEDAKTYGGMGPSVDEKIEFVSNYDFTHQWDIECADKWLGVHRARRLMDAGSEMSGPRAFGNYLDAVKASPGIVKTRFFWGALKRQLLGALRTRD